MSGKPRIWYLPTPEHTMRVFRPETFKRLLEKFDVEVNNTGRRIETEEIEQRIAEFDGIITGWGTAPFSEQALQRAERLKIIAHSAGSVKFMFTDELVEKYLRPRGIVVFSAREAIAWNVAEATVGMLIMGCRRWAEMIRHIQDTEGWRPPDVPTNGQYLLGCTLGLVAASTVARKVIELLRGWDLRIIVYDPYLSEEAAEELGVEKVGELNELFERADHVSIHLPNIPETRKMIGREQLRRLKRGAVLVNTARGAVLDHDALYEEAKTGRFVAVLDVTEPEPLPADSPLRKLPNVYITPHVAGAGFYGYLMIGDMTVQALEDFFAGKPVRGAIDLARYGQLA